MYLDFAVMLLIVFGVCMTFVTEFNFEGCFVFLHIINPLLMLAFFLFCSNQLRVKWPLLFTVLSMPSLYLIFALIFGAATDNYIYFFLDYTEYGVGNTVLFVLGILAGLIVVGVGLYYFNRFIHKHILKNV